MRAPGTYLACGVPDRRAIHASHQGQRRQACVAVDGASGAWHPTRLRHARRRRDTQDAHARRFAIPGRAGEEAELLVGFGKRTHRLTHRCMPTEMRAHTSTHLHAAPRHHANTHVNAHEHARVHVQTCACTRMRKHSHVCLYARSQARLHAHAQGHTNMHMSITIRALDPAEARCLATRIQQNPGCSWGFRGFLCGCGEMKHGIFFPFFISCGFSGKRRFLPFSDH